MEENIENLEQTEVLTPTEDTTEVLEMNPPKPKKEKKLKKDDKLKEEINRLQDENKHLTEKVKLAQAELINYRRRKDEETQSMLKYANQELVLGIITVVDSFERAIKQAENNSSEEFAKFIAGIKMIYANLIDTLKRFGVEEISRVGEVFDPKQEQALLTDTVDELDDEIVIEVLLKGYKLKDRVIRPASVKINQK